MAPDGAARGLTPRSHDRLHRVTVSNPCVGTLLLNASSHCVQALVGCHAAATVSAHNQAVLRTEGVPRVSGPRRRGRSIGLCASARGEWGELCPVCGRLLPPQPQPLRSWHAARATDADASERARRTKSPFASWHL